MWRCPSPSANYLPDFAQVPTKVFSLQNSTAFVYPKRSTCLLLELGAASSVVTLSSCDVLLHFEAEKDMQIFLQQRRCALNDHNLLPPPDGIMFANPNTNAGKGKKSGRYTMQLEREAMTFGKRERGVTASVVEIKFVDCRFDMLPKSIKMYCFWGEVEMYSADELSIIKCQMLQLMSK